MTAINDWIRDAARRRELRAAPGPDLETERQTAQRELAEALVAQDVAAGALEGIARIHRGLDRSPDFGGGPRGAPAGRPAPETNELIHEAIERSRATGGAVDVDAVRRDMTSGRW